MYVLELVGDHDRLARGEAATAASDVRALAPGLATARGVAGVERLALTRRASRLVGTAGASATDARALLGAATVDRSGSVAVRARDVRGSTGVDTRHVERTLGDLLVKRGLAVDLENPDHVLRALFAAPDRREDRGGDSPGSDVGGSDGDGPDGDDPRDDPDGDDSGGDGDDSGDDTDRAGTGTREGGDRSGEETDRSGEETDRSGEESGRSGEGSGPGAGESPGEGGRGVCALGWVAVEPPRSFAPAPTDRPFFQPGSMAPALARALANLAGARPGRRVVDPMCGTGGLILEAGLVGARVLGVDAQAKMAAGTARNCRAILGGPDRDAGRPRSDRGARPGWAVLQGDATSLPLADDSADGVVVDVPYGRQSAVAGDDLAALVEGTLREARRVAPRAVAVGDRDWTDRARSAGWTVAATYRRRVHRSLDRHVLVATR